MKLVEPHGLVQLQQGQVVNLQVGRVSFVVEYDPLDSVYGALAEVVSQRAGVNEQFWIFCRIFSDHAVERSQDVGWRHYGACPQVFGVVTTNGYEVRGVPDGFFDEGVD